MSQLQRAIDYFYINPQCSKNSVASKFSVGAGNFYTALKKHDSDVDVYNKIGEATLTGIDAWFSGNPGVGINDAAVKFGLTPGTLRAAYRGQTIAARRIRLANGYVEVDPVAEMREKCAAMAEMVGGEHGVAIAAAIRSM